MRFFSFLTLLVSGIVATPLSAQSQSVNGTVANGATILISGKGYASNYVCVSPFSAGVMSNTGTHTWYYEWTLVDASTDGETDVYYLYNDLSGLYIGKTNTTSQSQQLTTTSNVALAGRYKVESRDGGYYSFVDVDNTNEDCSSLNTAGSSGTLVNYALMNNTALRQNSLFTISNPDDEETGYATATASYILDNYESFVSKDVKYIGYIYDSSSLEAAIKAISGDSPAYADFKAFAEAFKPEMPIPGHYYRIVSAYPAYSEDYIAETYYTKDYHPAQGRQRLHFLPVVEGEMTIPVPSFWQFSEVDAKSGTDADHYYKIIAANTGLAWRVTGNNTQVDTREVDADGVGVYSIDATTNLLVYPHAVALLGHKDNDARTVTYYLGTFSDTDQDVYAIDLRDGNNRIEATDDPTVDNGLNNWYITEANEFTLYFPTPTSPTEEYSYRTVYFPFAVEVPSEVTAYSLLDQYSIKGSTAFELAEIALADGRRNIIPANTAAVLRGPLSHTATFKIRYDVDDDPITFDLVGTLAPMAVRNGEAIYVIDDAEGYTTKTILKIGGRDYSYDQDETFKSTSQSQLSLYGQNDVTYILDHNRAFIWYDGRPDASYNEETEEWESDLPDEKPMEEDTRLTTGVSTPVVTPVSRENMKYFDLNGRLVPDPGYGLYIREDGVKVLIR